MGLLRAMHADPSLLQCCKSHPEEISTSSFPLMLMGCSLTLEDPPPPPRPQGGLGLTSAVVVCCAARPERLEVHKAALLEVFCDKV
jgi:hypothetical protein